MTLPRNLWGRVCPFPIKVYLPKHTCLSHAISVDKMTYGKGLFIKERKAGAQRDDSGGPQPQVGSLSVSPSPRLLLELTPSCKMTLWLLGLSLAEQCIPCCGSPFKNCERSSIFLSFTSAFGAQTKVWIFQKMKVEQEGQCTLTVTVAPECAVLWGKRKERKRNETKRKEKKRKRKESLIMLPTAKVLEKLLRIASLTLLIPRLMTSLIS